MICLMNHYHHSKQNVLFEHISWMFQQFPMKLMNVVICVFANDVFPSFDNFQNIVLGLFQALM